MSSSDLLEALVIHTRGWYLADLGKMQDFHAQRCSSNGSSMAHLIG